MVKELRDTLIALSGNIHESELADFWRIGKIQHLNGGNFFIREAHVPTKFGFVISGLFRYTYVTTEGKELTKAFIPEKNFISSYSAMIYKQPSCFNIEALEDCVIFEADFAKWNKLREASSVWDKLLIELLEKGYSVKEKREREFLLFDAETRYKIFLEEFPTLENRIKQYMVASYLGITPIALSRIRKKLGFINIG